MRAPVAVGKQLAVLAAALGLCLVGACARKAPTSPARGADPLTAKLEPRVREALSRAKPGDRMRALLDLSEQVDLFQLRHRLDRRSRHERYQEVVARLEAVAARQQSRLAPRIEAALARGDLDYVKPVAIVNRLLLEGRAEAIVELARSEEAAYLWADWSSVQPPEAGVAGARTSRSAEDWLPQALGLEELWSSGITGRGVVVGILDSGVYGAHEQLRGRRLPGARGWFDPVEGSPEPYDSDTHGTLVLSIAVGGVPGGRRTGVAPEAWWTAGLANWRNHYSRWRMTEAADWMLRVARPDVLINAWSHDEGPCTAFDLPFINAWKAAGIVVVFAAGNRGPQPGSGEAPAQLAGAYPEAGPVLSVAALDRRGFVIPESSRGPSACNSPLFPALAAPGADLPHASPGGPDRYAVASGTSVAAAVVGGVAALLLQAVPEASPEAVERALLQTARDLPPAGADPVSGRGAIEPRAALDYLRRHPR